MTSTLICDLIGKTRPTAVNLFWAIRRMQEKFERIRIRPIPQIKRDLTEEAQRMHAEDIAANQAMGRHGATLMPSEGGVLTHCNAGALATAGYGTALGVIRAAVEQGKKIHVYADETRPFLQGSRLTAWELMKDGIPTTVISDNMAGAMMKQGKIGAIVVGADRIAANGDVANKIGTYTVAILAKEHGIPFYVAAPISTVDLACPDGSENSHRATQQQRSHAHRRQADGAGWRGRGESGIRCDTGEVRGGDHHGKRRRARAVRGVIAAVSGTGSGSTSALRRLEIQSRCSSVAAGCENSLEIVCSNPLRYLFFRFPGLNQATSHHASLSQEVRSSRQSLSGGCHVATHSSHSARNPFIARSPGSLRGREAVQSSRQPPRAQFQQQQFEWELCLFGDRDATSCDFVTIMGTFTADGNGNITGGRHLNEQHGQHSGLILPITSGTL